MPRSTMHFTREAEWKQCCSRTCYSCWRQTRYAQAMSGVLPNGSTDYVLGSKLITLAP